MARFLVRVELHDAAGSDYETLHESMEARGFSRTVAADDGTQDHLPTGEYQLTGSFDKEQVLTKAQRAAVTTRRRYAILVTEVIGQTWVGLDPVVS